MASRPIYIPLIDGQDFVVERCFDFDWHAGLSPSQKKKNVKALHECARKAGFGNILEISTKSESPLGMSLSAFNLKVYSKYFGLISLESAFQGSKVFEFGGPFTDLYGKKGGEIKRDKRLYESGKLISFLFEDMEWQLEPKTAFYDWLYLNSVHAYLKEHQSLYSFSGFSDIEFNPKRSFNCQARSCALYVSLLKRQMINMILLNREAFLSLQKRGYCKVIGASSISSQGKLFAI